MIIIGLIPFYADFGGKILFFILILNIGFISGGSNGVILFGSNISVMKLGCVVKVL